MVPDVAPVTLLQISDLHLGVIDPNTGDASIPPALRKLMANFSWFDGLMGHHSRGLEQLAKFWNGLRARDPQAYLIVSGDVTSCGGETEFGNAASYLSATLNLPVGAIGLSFSRWLDLAIPGNHDHWPGVARVFGGPDPAVNLAFLAGRYPYVESISRGSAQPIRVIGINTDSDVAPGGRHRMFAIGSFQSQLAKAATKLASLDPPGIRVLLMHHSWHKRGVLGISRASRGALSQFLDQESVRVILTGHVHTPVIRPFSVPTGASGGTYSLHECRCGTTTQTDKMSYGAKSILGGFPVRKWPSNTLLVHRITEDAGASPSWHVETFVRKRSGFASIGPKGEATIPL